jgi:hypothetical protein
MRLARLLAGELEMLSQAARGPSTNLSHLKGHAFDLLSDAIEGEAERMMRDGAAASGVRKPAHELFLRIKQFRASLIDVRQHLIELSADWRCGECASNAASAASISQQAPLAASLVCRLCGARTRLTPRGTARLRELFGHLGTSAWNPEANGFTR